MSASLADCSCLHADGELVTYKILKSAMWTPPEGHRTIASSVLQAEYTSEFELLEELGVIEIIDWGKGD